MVGPTIVDAIFFTTWMVMLYAFIAVPIWWVWWR